MLELWYTLLTFPYMKCSKCPPDWTQVSTRPLIEFRICSKIPGVICIQIVSLKLVRCCWSFMDWISMYYSFCYINETMYVNEYVHVHAFRLWFRGLQCTNCKIVFGSLITKKLSISGPMLIGPIFLLYIRRIYSWSFTA